MGVSGACSDLHTLVRVNLCEKDHSRSLERKRRGKPRKFTGVSHSAAERAVEITALIMKWRIVEALPAIAITTARAR